MVVPADIDTVSLVYWTMHSGSGFTAEPSGRVEVTSDGGSTWTDVGIQRGFAPIWYTDRVTIGGVRGKSLAFRFTALGMPWRIDEVALVGHGSVTNATVSAATQLRPSENPVRGSSVRFVWPFGNVSGEISVFDFTGREVWRRNVPSGESVIWELHAAGVANGAYVAIAKSGSKISRLKLFIARRNP